MIAMLFPLACDGCFRGFPAWVSLGLIVMSLIGTIYMLLWSNLGARLAYLVTITALSVFMMILSVLWMIGAPGTTTSTGPRGREVAWIPFFPDSEFAGDFDADLATFPGGDGWEPAGTVFPGKVDTQGEFESVRSTVTNRLADFAKVNDLEAKEASDWSFRDRTKPPVTPDEKELAPAVVAFNQVGSTKLIVGIEIPATSAHRKVTVFAYRDKGLVFLPSLMFFLVSLGMFILHTWLLGRYEREESEREAASKPLVPQPALN